MSSERGFRVGDRVRWTAKEIAWRRAEAEGDDITIPDDVPGTVTFVREDDGMIAVKPDDAALHCPHSYASTGDGDWWQEADEIELVPLPMIINEGGDVTNG